MWWRGVILFPWAVAQQQGEELGDDAFKTVDKKLSYPCYGINPYKCSSCPSSSTANHIMQDLEASCNIPKWLGLDTAEDLAEGSGVSDSLIYHTKWTQTSQVHPDLLQHLCISPICRWRIEMAFDAFAHCSTLDSGVTTSWRYYEGLSLQTVKHIILVMKSSKDSCRSTKAPNAMHTGSMIHQKFQMNGIDTRSDTTLREGESAFRQALSSLLDVPMRRMNVRIEAEPSPDCPRNFDNPVCREAKCGYGQCVASDDGSDYTCLCNECFKLGMQNGYKTCVKDEICFFENPCEQTPSPCKCGSECVPCPECQGEKYQCLCQLNFSGVDCSDLTCPMGFQELEAGGHACGVCGPIDATNVCDPNPCQHGGVCSVVSAEDSSDTFSCECHQNYGGATCEVLICPDGYFEEAGKCVSVETGKPTVEEDEFDPCEENPCLNGGHCLAEGSSYTCSCPPLYEGTTCATKVDVCYPDPCDGVPCIVDDSTALGYYCECQTCKEHGSTGSVFTGIFGRRLMPVFHELKRRKARNAYVLAKYGPKMFRKLQTAKDFDAMLYQWNQGKKYPGVYPMAADAGTVQYGGVDNINPACHVYQNGQGLGSEMTVSVKCPRAESDGENSDCEEIVGRMAQLQTSHEMQLELEKRTRFNCVAMQLEYISTPVEEVQISDCPSSREFNVRWHYVWEECGFSSMGFQEEDEWKVYIGNEGVETLDIEFHDLFCGNPVCRGMAMDLAALFKSCSNSAPGSIGKLTRKVKAMKNSLKVCGNPPGAVVSKQQLALNGVLDPLSKTELLETELFVKELIVNVTGIEKARAMVVTQPVLHYNDFWSKVPMTSNNIASRFSMPIDSFIPADLAGVEFGEEVDSPSCLGLCLATASPGPSDEFAADPGAPLFVTFSEPIEFGECVESDYCKITLVPDNSKYGYYTLDNDQHSSKTEVTIGGTVAQLRPRLFLKPNTNYTVTIEEGVFQGMKSRKPLPETQYWFQTGAPLGSTVKLSIMLGCDDQSSCDYYHSYLPDFIGDTQATLIEPIEEHLRTFRAMREVVTSGDEGVMAESDATPLAAINVPATHEAAAHKVVRTPAGRRLQDAPRRKLSEAASASVGDALTESRKIPQCKTVGTWFLMSAIGLVPIVAAIVAVALVARAIHPWVQDVAREGYQKAMVYGPHCDGGWKSKRVENPASPSAWLGGPWVYLPVLMVLSVLVAGAGAVTFMSAAGDIAIYYMSGIMAMTVCSMLWTLFVLVCSVWVDPGNLPFLSKRHKAMMGNQGQWNMGSKYRNTPLSQYPLEYGYSEKDDHDSQTVEGTVVDRLESVDIQIPRQVTSGVAAQSRLSCPIEAPSAVAQAAHTVASINIIIGTVTFTGLAMQLCPQPVSINLVNGCFLIGVLSSCLFIALGVILMKHHTFQPVVAVDYKLDNQDYCGQSFLAHDMEFKENSNVVEKFNIYLPQVAQAAGVVEGMELVEIIERFSSKTTGVRTDQKKDVDPTKDVRKELSYLETYGTDFTLIFKHKWYPMRSAVTRYGVRNSKYLPALLPSIKKGLEGTYGGTPAQATRRAF